MTKSATTMTGTIKTMVTDKGFGFIAAADGTEFFFHRSAAPEFDSFGVGIAVTFVPTEGQKGPRAEDVQRA